MNAGTHPQVAAVLQQTTRLHTTLDHYAHQVDTQTYTGTDEARTVQVTLDGRRWLTDLYVTDGLLRLGGPTVAQRINEALCNAREAAGSVISAQQEALIGGLAQITAALQTHFGLQPAHDRDDGDIDSADLDVGRR
ncbi:YbaB/EbfC family nucleoid-associated protein [Mycobacterium decipiens]|uniref:DNA-binding protein n=1 Tax=Mycobacterium decipiens TaxID=1430326 RepID=A0A1X2LU50_9MYCO|nr:YbaB/EbfC family nucleoid-associated protein [Mycobacterium decipiens]OSC40343.1 hypothetical protein B8W66_13660 [Mycobacterium decipiens]